MFYEMCGENPFYTPTKMFWYLNLTDKFVTPPPAVRCMNVAAGTWSFCLAGTMLQSISCWWESAAWFMLRKKKIVIKKTRMSLLKMLAGTFTVGH